MAPHDMEDMTAGAAAATTTTDGHDMDDMSMSTSHAMMSVFFTAQDTPLYSTAWTPASLGAYVGTCIFLIVLAALLRALVAGRAYMEARWLDREMKRRYVVVAGRQGLAARLSDDETAGLKRDVTLSENGVEERVAVVQRHGPVVRPWRLSVEPVRAVLDVVIAGVGYMLMLAVMSMNIGYFLSVLGGVFLGSLAVGRYAVSGEH